MMNEMEKAIKTIGYCMEFEMYYGKCPTKLKIVADDHISDLETVKRTLKERLFSKPWNPFKTHKTVNAPKMYFLGENILLCSQKTKQKIENALAGL